MLDNSNNMSGNICVSVTEAILSDFTEISNWIREGLGHDVHNLHSALMLVTCAKNHCNYWPLLIDPESQAECILRITNRQTGKSMTSI